MSHQLDATFAALADPTRRAILARLTSGEASVTELAEPFAMSQPAISKHLKVLERAGLITRGRDAQRRPCRLQAAPLSEASQWLENYREMWESSFQRLDVLLDEMKEQKKRSGVNDGRDSTMKNTGTLKVTTPTEREILMTRVFDAPRDLIFEALTRPELLQGWFFSSPNWSLAVCEIDLRVGGSYRYVWRRLDGTEMGMGGVFEEIRPPVRIVQTESFDDAWYPGNQALNTTVLVEEGGRTTMTLSVLYESKEARDSVLKGPMDQGVAAAFDRLAEMLPSIEVQTMAKGS